MLLTEEQSKQVIVKICSIENFLSQYDLTGINISSYRNFLFDLKLLNEDHMPMVIDGDSFHRGLTCIDITKIYINSYSDIGVGSNSKIISLCELKKYTIEHINIHNTIEALNECISYIKDRQNTLDDLLKFELK